MARLKTTDPGFPPRQQIKDALLLLIYERGGEIRTQDRRTGWSVYEALADWLSLSDEARTRKTEGDPRPAWRAQVGYRRKDLVEEKLFYDNDVSGDGIWRLTELGMETAKRLITPYTTIYPDEVATTSTYPEGTVVQVAVNRYERSPEARRKCIEHYGLACSVCRFEFAQAYGSVAEQFIHVHHLRLLSRLGEDYEINPVEDLRPVCPNCHSVLHLKDPPYTIEEAKSYLHGHIVKAVDA